MSTCRTDGFASGDTAAAPGPWSQALRDAAALAAPYWRTRSERKAWWLLAAVVALTLGGVALNVRLSTWNSAFYDALQNHDARAFWHQLGVFCALAAAFIVAAVYRQYLQQLLVMRWRVWLTEWLLARWLQPGTAYRLGSLARGSDAQPPDNPDQRIAEDVQQFVSVSLSLSLGLLNALVTLVSFVTILWGLSGAWPLTVAGTQLQVPGYMVWVALAYAGLGTWLTQRIGCPLVPLGIQQQRVEADFRYALVQVRDHAEAIALARGEAPEEQRLRQRLDSVRLNWWRLITATKRLTWFSAGYSQAAVVFPLLAASPRYFAGQLALGGLMQTAQAFGQVQGALSWFVDGFTTLADWRATVHRLTAFSAALQADGLARPPQHDTQLSRADLVLELKDVSLQTPSGRKLLEVPYAAVASGERVLLSGPSGQGKSSLLRALAGLWPSGGRIRARPGLHWAVLPQRPYLPQASLRATLAWPATEGSVNDDRLRSVLEQVELPALAHALDQEADWGRVLSPGEQQRLCIARVLLQRPQLLLLDEASSALDLQTQDRLHALLALELPECTVLSVAHRPELGRWHGKNWQVDGARLVVAPKPRQAEPVATLG